jgi:cell division transport system permease protein
MTVDAAPARSRVTSLIPHDSVAGRALTVVIAILTFLACLAAGGAVLLGDASAAWRNDVSKEVTVQIKPMTGEDADAEVEKVLNAAKASPLVAAARAVGRDETERSLAPWLGSGIDLSQLPIPRLVVVTLAKHDSDQIRELRARVLESAPGAVFDDHAIWLTHLSTVGRSLTLFIFLLFALVVAAIAIAVGVATRAAIADAREIIEVLHFVGASDEFITRHFQQSFFRISAEGAGIGGGAAMLSFVVGQFLFSRGGTEDAEAMTVLLGAFHLPLHGYIAIIAVCVLLVAMTAVFSRLIAAANLRRIY